MVLLIAEPVIGAAIGTRPGNAVTGHTPFIFVHALLADGKPAPACPAKGKGPAAAMTYPALFPATFLSSLFLRFSHGAPVQKPVLWSGSLP